MRDLIKLVDGILLGGAMLAVLSACGGSAGALAPVPTPPQATATAEPTVAPTSTPPAGAVLPATPQTSTQPAGSSQSDPLALGKLVFEKTAGGVGCAYCHGLDGKGGGISTPGGEAPDIRGAKEAQLRAALAGGVPLMTFIKLSEEELEAVTAYVQYLNEQP